MKNEVRDMIPPFQSKQSVQIEAPLEIVWEFSMDLTKIPSFHPRVFKVDRSRTVRFNTAAEMLDFFRLFKDGKRYHRIMEGFQRIFAATIFFGTSDQPDAKLLLDWARFHFFDRLHLWFHHDEPATAALSGAENLIVLSEAFYEEIDQHRIPVEREVVALLANGPGVLDLYVWLVWKTWTLNAQSVRIPLFGTGGLSNQLGSEGYSADRFFRRKIRRWLREVQALWPQCPASISADGHNLVLYSAKRNPAIVCSRGLSHIGSNCAARS
jgi:hypothetical protein